MLREPKTSRKGSLKRAEKGAKSINQAKELFEVFQGPRRELKGTTQTDKRKTRRANGQAQDPTSRRTSTRPDEQHTQTHTDA